MASKPKPFLKKGQGKYTKIDYPVLRRSGVYQPPPDTQPPQHSRSSPRREQRRIQAPSHPLPPYSLSPSPSPARRPAPSLAIPPMSTPAETGVMGVTSPPESDYSRTSDSPPRATAFGSSLERRMGESDEGVRDMMSASPPLPSGRPRTAGTVDSGFPRDEMPPLSPVSSSGETRASSMPSMIEDLTCLRLQGDHHDGILRPLHTPLGVAAAAAESELMVEPAATAVRPTPAPRSRLGDRSAIGTTTAEFERREQHALRDATPSSLSSTSSSTKGLQVQARHLIHHVGDDRGEEEPRLRQRQPLASAADGRVREEVLGGLPPPPPQSQRMMDLRLDTSVASSASLLSPIENSDGRPKNVLDGDSFRGSDGSRPGSSSHFRIATSSVESAAVDQRGRRDERLQPRPVQQPPLQPVRRSVEEGSEASSGSTAAARNFLLGDRRPLDELRSGGSSEEITGTQQRPRPLTRASQATMRHKSNIIIQEEFSDAQSEGEEETIVLPNRGAETRGGLGRRGETSHPHSLTHRERELQRREGEVRRREGRVQLMETQLRDAIAHADLGDAALRRMKQELLETFHQRVGEVAAAYAAKEKRAKEEWLKKEEELRMEKTAVDQMRLEVEKERRLLRKDEAAKVKEYKTKLEEEQKKYAEEKKKNNTESSRRRLAEEKNKKEREEAAAVAAALKTDNERMRNIIEGQQRNRAVSRGHSAHRAARERAEDEAAAAPPRNGLQRSRYGGSVNDLADKENVLPSGRSPAAAAAVAPQGILKKNQVRFADTTFTVYPPDDTYYRGEQGTGHWGPCITYANNLGRAVRVSTPDCGCVAFEYANGDVRHFTPDGAVTFHYIAANGSMQFDFPKERCQIIYFANGTLEIFRTGKEITTVTRKGERIERIETMKDRDGNYYAEIWRDNAMAIYNGGPMGEMREQYECGKKVTHRQSWVGHSFVALHSNRDLEFIESNFIATYHAAQKYVEVTLNHMKANEIRYRLRPEDSVLILHNGEMKQQCIQFGLHQGVRSSQQ